MPLNDPPGGCIRDCWGSDGCCNGVRGVLVKFDGTNKPANGSYTTKNGVAVTLSNVTLGDIDGNGVAVGIGAPMYQIEDLPDNPGEFLWYGGSGVEYFYGPDLGEGVKKLGSVCCSKVVGYCGIAYGANPAETGVIRLAMNSEAYSVGVYIQAGYLFVGWWVRGEGDRPDWLCHLPKDSFQEMETDPAYRTPAPYTVDDIDHAIKAQVKASIRSDFDVEECCPDCLTSLGGYSVEVSGLTGLTWSGDPPFTTSAVGGDLTNILSQVYVEEAETGEWEKPCKIADGWYWEDRQDGVDGIGWIDETALVPPPGDTTGRNYYAIVEVSFTFGTGADAGKICASVEISIGWDSDLGEVQLEWVGSDCQTFTCGSVPTSFEIETTAGPNDTAGATGGTLTITLTPP